ncbi:alpha/beta hydrolase [Azospirillum sp.]|uniref:alpha/beta hydrolase n=1 Tax=Azospirillum sp. TaxID=34012 RepID=UPI003D75371E
MPRLEILTRRPAGRAKPAPLLFVHGAYCGAWIWDAKMLGWFADRGWSAHAVSLRGHGGSAGRDRIRFHTLADYVEDVLEAFDGFDTPPVLIGHSMGGMVVQRALRKRRAPAGVLMASAPPHGLWESSLSLAFRDPYVFQQMALLTAFGERAVDPEGIRRAMFSDRMPRAEARLYEPRLQEESQAVLLDMYGWTPFPPLPDRDIPFLVLGAGGDLLVPTSQVHATARTLGTQAVIVPDMGHTMMLEPGWEQVAERIAGWLEERL